MNQEDKVPEDVTTAKLQSSINEGEGENVSGIDSESVRENNYE